MVEIQEIPSKLLQSETASSIQQPAATAITPAIPVNPKGFFANERTFLHWQSLTLILGSVGIGLLNFSQLYGQISGTIFILISMSFSFYALVQFHKRQDLLARKAKGLEYEDVNGLIVMIFVIFVAVFINFLLHFIYQ